MAVGKFAVPASATGGGGTLTRTLRQYTSSTTWTKPSGLQFVEVLCVGAGGGGGSGTTAAAGIAAPGGGGGGAPHIAWTQISEASLAATVTVTVGAGGSGGASVTANSTVGNNGGAGGNTSFGSHCIALGGNGTTSGRNGGAQRQLSTATPAYGWGVMAGSEGKSGSATGGNGQQGSSQSLAVNFGDQIQNLLGGPSGGGVTTANIAGLGAQGNQYYLPTGLTTTRAQGGNVEGANGNAGTSNATERMVWTPNIAALTPSYKLGVSGGSGAAGATTNGGFGGNAGAYGGSGAGGGGCRNGFTSGAGGSGSGGLMFLIEYTI